MYAREEVHERTEEAEVEDIEVPEDPLESDGNAGNGGRDGGEEVVENGSINAFINVRKTIVDDCSTRRAQIHAMGIIQERNCVKKVRESRERFDESQFRQRDVAAPNLARNYGLRGKDSWFNDARRVGLFLLEILQKKWIEVPHLMCLQMREQNKRMVSVRSARAREKNRMIMGMRWSKFISWWRIYARM